MNLNLQLLKYLLVAILVIYNNVPQVLNNQEKKRKILHPAL